MSGIDLIEVGIDALRADRDAWKARAERYLHLLALVEDDIKDAHTLGEARAALED